MFNNGVRHMNSMPLSARPQPVARRDTRAGVVQVWVSFGLAAFLSATGLYWLPGSLIERAFMLMAYVFSLSSVFVLSRHVRDQADGLPQTPMWGLVVWTGFGAALALTGWGALIVPVAVLAIARLLLVNRFEQTHALTDDCLARLARRPRWRRIRRAGRQPAAGRGPARRQCGTRSVLYQGRGQNELSGEGHLGAIVVAGLGDTVSD